MLNVDEGQNKNYVLCILGASIIKTTVNKKIGQDSTNLIYFYSHCAKIICDRKLLQRWPRPNSGIHLFTLALTPSYPARAVVQPPPSLELSTPYPARAVVRHPPSLELSTTYPARCRAAPTVISLQPNATLSQSVIIIIKVIFIKIKSLISIDKIIKCRRLSITFANILVTFESIR